MRSIENLKTRVCVPMLNTGELCQEVARNVECFYIGQLEQFRRDRTQIVIGDVNVCEEVAFTGQERRREQCQ